MKQHPVIGAEKVLAPNEALRDLIPMVKYHHEHYDGSGYLKNLKVKKFRFLQGLFLLQTLTMRLFQTDLTEKG